jgi:LacI family transcriptional regulator
MGTFVSEVVDHVAIDIGPGIVDAVNHLWAQGRRRIAYLTLAAMSDVDVAGSGSYTNAITALGGADERILLPLHGRSVARTGIVEYFRTNGQPDAIIARSDEYAIGAFRGLRDLGLSVPGDVAIVGCGGIDDVRYLDPELSTVTVPIDEMSKLAWRFLKQRIKHPTSPLQSAKLYATLDVRGSSA